MGWLLRALGAFPVERGKGDAGALDRAREIVRRRGVLGMFIEGTRSKTGALGRPKSGTAMIAQQTGAGVLPCAIRFEGKLGWRTHVTIRYGELIPNEALGFTGGELSPHEMKAASHRIMGEIAALLEVGE